MEWIQEGTVFFPSTFQYSKTHLCPSFKYLKILTENTSILQKEKTQNLEDLYKN